MKHQLKSIKDFKKYGGHVREMARIDADRATIAAEIAALQRQDAHLQRLQTAMSKHRNGRRILPTTEGDRKKVARTNNTQWSKEGNHHDPSSTNNGQGKARTKNT